MCKQNSDGMLKGKLITITTAIIIKTIIIIILQCLYNLTC